MKKRYWLLICVVLTTIIIFQFTQKQSQVNNLRFVETIAFTNNIDQSAFLLENMSNALLMYENNFNEGETQLLQQLVQNNLVQLDFNISTIRTFEETIHDTHHLADVLFDSEVNPGVINTLLDNPEQEFTENLALIFSDTKDELNKINPYRSKSFSASTYEDLSNIFHLMHEKILDLI